MKLLVYCLIDASDQSFRYHYVTLLWIAALLELLLFIEINVYLANQCHSMPWKRRIH